MSYCEDLCEKSLKLVLKDNVSIIRNYRPDWLKNPKTGRNLEVDFYLPEIDICIEIQGEHHYYDEGQKWKDAYKKSIILERNLWLLELSILQISPNIIWGKIKKCFRDNFVKPFDNNWLLMQEFKDYRNNMKHSAKESSCIINPHVHKNKNRINKEILKIKKYIFAKRWLRVKVENSIIKMIPFKIISRQRRIKCGIKDTSQTFYICRNQLIKSIFLDEKYHYDKNFHGVNNNLTGASNTG